ncbi:MAG: cyclic pyranopterin monophosphate synthase MoaC [Candidatus Dormibacteraeota bacterium]|uniref:Cyclic pyranopterin monophosphate synthase n=1 Tax=Candidatus Amunia macphersoniae TaxID=3127014 RepID=A0A934NG94_9BACT|nr:cyclic pyranopterin monophosphate synthase MoaC [Candidatus Dormibacteraeota bacterium]
MSELTHVDAAGEVRMVDVSAKPESVRSATADATVRFHEAGTVAVLRGGDTAKGNVLATARLAGIMAAKRTAELIPLCHSLPLDHVAVDIEIDEQLPGLRISATARCRGATGVEMEALTAVSLTALTVIDMLKSVDRWIAIENIRLREKSGGRHGHISRPANGP